MRDLICDVISYCVSIFSMVKISEYDQIVIKPKKKRAKYQTNF